MADPARGEIWLTDLGLTEGHEQGGRRAALVLSIDPFNSGPAGLVIVLPLTTTIRNLPADVLVNPPEGGLRAPSVVLCDAVRSVSQGRLITCWGTVSGTTLTQVERAVRFLLGL